jgi:hypothetical protein
MAFHVFLIWLVTEIIVSPRKWTGGSLLFFGQYHCLRETRHCGEIAHSTSEVGKYQVNQKCFVRLKSKGKNWRLKGTQEAVNSTYIPTRKGSTGQICDKLGIQRNIGCS